MVADVKDIIVDLFSVSKNWQEKYIAYIRRAGKPEVRADILPYAFDGTYIIEEIKTGIRREREYSRKDTWERIY